MAGNKGKPQATIKTIKTPVKGKNVQGGAKPPPRPDPTKGKGK